MALTITLPDSIGARLQSRAEAEHRPVEELALDILASSVEEYPAFPTPENVAAKIKAIPPAPGGLSRASGSLADALRSAPDTLNFDHAEWQREWNAVESEMKAMTRANNAAEAHPPGVGCRA